MEMRVGSYEEFVEALDQLGFLLFGGEKSGLLTLSAITDPLAWHQGDERDPWGWKDRLPAGKRGAYARVLGGQAFLISPEWYPVFVAAYTPRESLAEAYECGLVDPLSYRMHQLFEERPVWARHELYSALSITAKQKGKLERALNLLQQRMFITISGTSQKLSWEGRPIGWPSNEYTRVDAWAPEAWLERAMELDGEAARQSIRARAAQLSPQADPLALDQLFGARLG